jgi:hypothetical protein
MDMAIRVVAIPSAVISIIAALVMWWRVFRHWRGIQFCPHCAHPMQRMAGFDNHYCQYCGYAGGGAHNEDKE